MKLKGSTEHSVHPGFEVLYNRLDRAYLGIVKTVFYHAILYRTFNHLFCSLSGLKTLHQHKATTNRDEQVEQMKQTFTLKTLT